MNGHVSCMNKLMENNNSLHSDPLQNLKFQRAESGRGPLYHRSYTIEFFGRGLSPEELMLILQSDPNRFAPKLLARFEKTKGDPEIMKKGDHFLIHITGPWNGPVEVLEVTPLSFTLITLEGHMEAGQIKFSLHTPGDKLCFVIESWARSRDRLIDLLYDKLHIARAAQTEMWTAYCQSFAEFADGRTQPPNIKPDIQPDIKFDAYKVNLETEKFDEDSKKWIAQIEK